MSPQWTHPPILTPPEPALQGWRERFPRCYLVEFGGCWRWKGARDKRGYGRAHVQTETGERETGAHRLSYILHKGPISPGMTVHHECDNPPCVNPSHLKEKPLGDNIRLGNPGRKPSAGARWGQPTRDACKHGHAYVDGSWRHDSRGYIICKQCMSAAVRRCKARQKENAT